MRLCSEGPVDVNVGDPLRSHPSLNPLAQAPLRHDRSPRMRPQNAAHACPPAPALPTRPPVPVPSHGPRGTPPALRGAAECSSPRSRFFAAREGSPVRAPASRCGPLWGCCSPRPCPRLLLSPWPLSPWGWGLHGDIAVAASLLHPQRRRPSSAGTPRALATCAPSNPHGPQGSFPLHA